jgi:hypothetical protein
MTIMNNNQIELIKKVVSIMSEDVFPIINRMEDKEEINQCLIAIMASIKMLSELVKESKLNEVRIRDHGKESQIFSKIHNKFLKDLMKKIEEKNLKGTIIIQTKGEKQIDTKISTMSEDDLIGFFADFFIKNDPNVFIGFIQKIVKKTDKFPIMIGHPMIPPFTPFNEGDEE